jgi:hypothetical protein
MEANPIQRVLDKQTVNVKFNLTLPPYKGLFFPIYVPHMIFARCLIVYTDPDLLCSLLLLSSSAV